MNLAEHSSFIQSLIEKPYDQRTLLAVYEAMGKDPKAYAALLTSASERTDEDAAASHWLTEAARVRIVSLRDEKGGVRLLESALERDPLNMRAAEQLVELYRTRHDDAELAAVLRARVGALHERYVREPVELPRAALVFEKLSGVYEALGDSTAAIGALRTALELERARVRATTPSPPPDGPPESSFRALAIDSNRAGWSAPPPESPWTGSPEPESRDTLRSPIPARVRESLRGDPPSTRGDTEKPPSSPRPRSGGADPLLLVIEALHALRRSEDVVEGAALVLRTAMTAVPSVSGMVHVADVGTRDFVVVAASGEHNAEVIGTRTTESDPVIARALGSQEAVLVEATSSGWLTGSRFRVLCPGRALLCAPVQFDGRHLGAIELVDPTGSAAFTDADRHAMTYVGERFGEFLADRSIAF